MGAILIVNTVEDFGNLCDDYSQDQEPSGSGEGRGEMLGDDVVDVRR